MVDPEPDTAMLVQRNGGKQKSENPNVQQQQLQPCDPMLQAAAFTATPPRISWTDPNGLGGRIASGRFSQNAWNKGNSPKIDPAPKEWPKTQSQFPICKSCDLQKENCWTVTCSFKIEAV